MTSGSGCYLVLLNSHNMTTEQISFRALNSDNDSEVIQVMRLFERSYGKSFPLVSVYDQKFWKTHSGSRFTSLIALDGYKVIAHLAIRPDRENPSHVQICLPVCDPDYHSLHEALHAELIALVERQSVKQGWRMMYYHVVTSLPEMKFVANSVLEAKEVAIWPFCLPPTADSGSDTRHHVLVAQKMLPSGATQKKSTSSNNVLFAPEWHLDVCRSIYSSLEIKKAISAERIQDEPSLEMAYPADRRAVETRSYRRTGIVLSNIEPSLVSSFKRTVVSLLEQPCPWQFVAVNMRDVKTPAFCQVLEENGFRFCGVLPYHRNRHSIVYACQRSNKISAKELLVPDSALAQYIENYRIDSEQDRSWKTPGRGKAQQARTYSGPQK